ncbi:RDD family protein [Halobacillus locisalis]|uniref:RDD family protein n=1 Tax=Halobacillus locisalis TaxID=220753 RepID=A0A838CWV7_9BACI|nr:RDD family protein [Halobacillus locisalis]MBA2176255.1 RDD family protein [Halobacillus locisalis]
MKAMTKKRTKAVLIDLAISGVVTAGVECLLRKKVRKEWVHALITPTTVAWGLEYAQLRSCGQTVGYKAMGLKLESEDGSPACSAQIIKRMAHRDMIGGIVYLKNRRDFEGQDGAVLPHDTFSGTIVKEE